MHYYERQGSLVVRKTNTKKPHQFLGGAFDFHHTPHWLESPLIFVGGMNKRTTIFGLLETMDRWMAQVLCKENPVSFT